MVSWHWHPHSGLHSKALCSLPRPTAAQGRSAGHQGAVSDGVRKRYPRQTEESSAPDPALPLLLPAPPLLVILPINKWLVSPSQLLTKQEPPLTNQELLARHKLLPPYQVLPLADEELLPLPPHPLPIPLSSP